VPRHDGPDTTSIRVVGAREHNLRDLTVEIPRDALVVITGLSGSGKSSLAFDTLYAEGQRRYVESLSAYARQFLGQMDKPDVDHIDGLSPAISIDQKTTSRNPRSTVGTVTEVYDYLRLLFARVGEPHCPICGRPIGAQSIEQIADRVLELPEGTRFQVMAPLVRGRKGEHRDVIEHARAEGFARLAVDGTVYRVEEVPALDRNFAHTIEVVVDRLVMREDLRRRLTDSLETASSLSDGLVRIEEVGGEERSWTYSERFACPEHGASLDELAPRTFSFNSPHGACPTCTGLGYMLEVDPDLVIDPDRTLRDGSILPWTDRTTDYYDLLLPAIATRYGIDLDTPWRRLPGRDRKLLLEGPGRRRERIHLGRRRKGGSIGWFEGVLPQLRRQHAHSMSQAMRESVEQFMSLSPCPSCGGARLRPEALAVTVGGLDIDALCRLSVGEALAFFAGLELSRTSALIAARIVQEVTERLRFLDDVGVGYLSLARAAGTLSGGEAQRIRLATQIGSGLVGVLYILDEPSIGLHQRDNRKLIGTLARLRDQGNTVLVVEHDEEMIRAADHVIDMGPGAGEHGGDVVAEGTVADVEAAPGSVTGAFLSGRRTIPVPDVRRAPRDGAFLTVRGAREHNLRGIDVAFPIGALTCVTGVSGSGKSTLVNEIVLKALAGRLNRRPRRPGAHTRIDGMEHLDKVIAIDQSPIGRTPRSNPATYTGVFDHIRKLFSLTAEARARGYTPGRFSFNVKGGRCEACKGDGTITIEMHFLPDVYVPCEVCGGKRYNRETLAVRYGGRTIADVLGMSVEEALAVFSPVPRIHRRLQTLHDVGLDYIRLGQPATTLSGGEAQRVKLATELSRVATGRTLYVLDEPTTGLHFADIEKLLEVLQKLVDQGNTVVVIEHNLDVIKSADWLVDLGPEGGAGGGALIATGTPERVAAEPGSATGEHLRAALRLDRAPLAALAS
jgi:excinuclease ABC subunit A